MPLCHYSAAIVAMSFDGMLNGKMSRKKAAHWTNEQEETLLDFLHGEIHSMGDGNFKKSMYTAASNDLMSKYPIHTLPHGDVHRGWKDSWLVWAQIQDCMYNQYPMDLLLMENQLKATYVQGHCWAQECIGFYI